MNKKEQIIYGTTLKYLPSATKVELTDEHSMPILFVFFKAGDNEFGENETKSVRMLRIYTMMGDEKFDEFLASVEEKYKLFYHDRDPQTLDVKFLFV